MTTKVVHGITVKFPTLCRRAFTARGEPPSIAMTKVKTVIDVSVEMLRPMEPWSRPDKQAIYEPFRAIIAIRGAVVGRDLVIPVWTDGRKSNIDRNARR
jgi:hypothetical protein